MKTKDIKPGVVYAYRRGKFGRIEPVVFVAAPSSDRLYAFNQWAKYGEPVFQHRPNADKPRRGRGFSDPDVGYPVAFARSQGTDAKVLAKATLEQFESATTTTDADLDVHWQVVTIPSHILGPYDQVIAEEDAAERARREQYAMERQQRDETQKRANQLLSALAEHGITAVADEYSTPPQMLLSLDDVEHLLGKLDRERG